ncbi:MAG: ABC transporter permease subunit [Candidatus Kapaibacterium sp.]
MLKILLMFEFKNLLKAKWFFFYAGFYFILTEALYYFSADPTKVYISLLNIILIVMPLISIIYGTQHFYNSKEYIQFLLAQPIDRKYIFLSNYISSLLATVGGFFVGAGIPLIAHELRGDVTMALFILSAGTLLGGIFLSIGFYIANKYDDKAKGLGSALVVWFFLCFLYDGLILGVLYFFSDYPIELPALIMSMLNPNDLARLFITLKLDVAALMGYTGAVYKNMLGTSLGLISTVFLMIAWFIIPLFMSYRKFDKKDF